MRVRGRTIALVSALFLVIAGAAACEGDEPGGNGSGADAGVGDTGSSDSLAGDTNAGDGQSEDAHADIHGGDSHAEDGLAGDAHEDAHVDDAHAGDAHEGDAHEGDGHQGDAHTGDPHWSYEGETGPEHWGSLSDKYALCETGMAQSPIDIVAVSPASHPAMNFAWKTSKAVVLNNGHTVQFNYDPGSTLTVDGHTFALTQLHYHARSEHTVGGHFYPAELHFVHEAEGGKLGVVGVFIEEGEETEALNPVVDNLPTEEQKATAVPGVTIDAAALLPAVKASWRYDGSLTVPPCTEGVEWFVMSQPITASTAQITKLTKVFDHNWRPAQPLHDRHVEGPHWGYEGETGPEHWADLSPDFALCSEGQAQSPIDIPSEWAVPDVPEMFHVQWEPAPLAILNNGHTVEVRWEPGSELVIDGMTYELDQFHFHAHSEHLVSGADWPLEIHFVHYGPEGAAVVGVFVEEGPEENDALASILPYVPEALSPVLEGGPVIDAMGLLPPAQETWRYDGSLTTPKCTEGVRWNVMAQPISATKDQIEALAAVLHGNHRPVQPLNGRSINGIPGGEW